MSFNKYLKEERVRTKDEVYNLAIEASDQLREVIEKFQDLDMKWRNEYRNSVSSFYPNIDKLIEISMNVSKEIKRYQMFDKRDTQSLAKKAD